MNLLRFLRPECISLALAWRPSPVEPDEEPAVTERRRRLDKEGVLLELAGLFEASGAIVNGTKFYKDLLNRERKATTAIGRGVAIPHVRSKQVRTFVMGFARAIHGVDFDSLDGEPTRLFFMMASPSHNDSDWDRIYLKIYRQLAEMMQHDWFADSFVEAEDAQDILNIMRGYIT